MKINKLGAIIAFLILGVTIRPQAGPPQTKQQVLSTPLQHEVSVVLKLIQAYVTDKKGKLVTDLIRDDFVLIDNGKPVAITEFEKHAIGPITEKSVSGKLSEAPAQRSTGEIPVARPTVRKFFLFFDMAFNSSRGVAKAKKAALHFLDSQVKLGDEVGVISYSTFGGIKVHEFLTGDHSKVRKVLENLGPTGGAGRAEELEALYWRLVQEGIPPEANPGPPPQRISPYLYDAMAERENLKKLTQAFILSLTTLAKALRYIPDQKVIILFSSGIPNSLIYGNQAGNAYLPPQNAARGSYLPFDPGDPTLKPMNEAMFKEFAASGCTFFAFDTSAKGMNLFGYEDRTAGPGSSNMSISGPIKDTNVTGRNFLKRLSDITGGQYFSNIDRYEQNLERLQTLTGTYYVLGYPTEERWDGRFHDVKVEVKRKGCEVRTPVGYFNPKPFSEYTKLEKELHLYDLALNARAFSRLPVDVPMTSLAYGDGASSRLGIVARLPGAVTEKLAGGRIEFVAIFFDGEGEIREVVRAETDPAAFRGRTATFTAGVELEPGSYSCRLVARDMDTGLSAVASAVATVGTSQAAGLRLSTPLILTEGAGGSYIDAGPLKKKDPLAFMDVYAYDRSRFSPVVAELPQGAVSFWAIVPYSAPGEVEPDLAVSAHLVDAKSAARTPVSFTRIERVRGGPQGLLSFEIPVDGWAPGTYFLHVHAEDRASRSIGHTYTTLVVPQR